MRWTKLFNNKKTPRIRSCWYKQELLNLNKRKVWLTEDFKKHKEERTLLRKWMKLRPKRSKWKESGIRITKFKSIWTDKSLCKWNKLINSQLMIDLTIYIKTIVQHFYMLRKNSKESHRSSNKITELPLWKNNKNIWQEKNGKIEANRKLPIEIMIETSWIKLLTKLELQKGLIMLLKLTKRPKDLRMKKFCYLRIWKPLFKSNKKLNKSLIMLKK